MNIKLKKNAISLAILFKSWFKHSAESEATRPSRHWNFSLHSTNGLSYPGDSRSSENSFRLGKFGLKRLRDSKEQPTLPSQPILTHRYPWTEAFTMIFRDFKGENNFFFKKIYPHTINEKLHRKTAITNQSLNQNQFSLKTLLH